MQFESGTKSISSNSKAGKGCLVNSEGSSGSDAEGRTPPDVTFSVSEPSEAVLSASNTEVKCTSPMEGFPQKSTDSSETQNDIKKDPDVEEDLSMFNVILRRNNDRIMKYSSTMRQGSTLANSVRMWERLSTVGQSNTDSPDLPDGVVSSPSRHVVTENIKEAQQESQTCEVTPLSSTPRNSDSKYQMLRLSVINELIKTEKDYVKDLEIIIQKFLIPIHSSGTITMCEESRLFSNIEAIYEVNLSFLRKLQERERESPEMKDMADILVEIVRDLYVYSDYCSNYPAAIRTSKKLLEENKELKALMNNILKDPEIRGLSFGSFLIKPIQRICKYPLLIKDLDKYTSKISRETIHIKLALKKLDEVMQLINNSTQVLDEEPLYASIISRINPPLPFSPQKKRLIREGYLGLYSAFIMRRRYCVLLENAFIVFRPERNGELRWLNVVIFDHHTAIDITEDLCKSSLFQRFNSLTTTSLIQQKRL